jgi:hypothetical protein
MPMKVFNNAKDYLEYEEYELNQNDAAYSEFVSKLADESDDNKLMDREEIENWNKCCQSESYNLSNQFDNQHSNQIKIKNAYALIRRFGWLFNVSKLRPVLGQYYYWRTCERDANNYIVCESWKLKCHSDHRWDPMPKKGIDF